MRRLLIPLLLASSAAFANDMTAAGKLLEAKEYAKALAAYTRLADAGNTEAQLRVGEMHWYGEGTPQDLQVAYRWFEKAAAAGNTDAKAALIALERRKTRGGEIDYWTSQYDGADLRSGKFDCKPPAIPELSKTNDDINATRDGIEAWRICHNGFVANLNATAPIGKRIPAEVLDMMTLDEVDRAKAHVEAVYGKVLAQVDAEVESVRTRQAAWETATERFVKDENARIARQQKEETERLVELQRRMNENSALQRPDRAPTIAPPPGQSK